MRRSASIFAALTALSACGEPPKAPPTVPADLVQPVAAPCAPFRVEADVARCLARQQAAIARANAQLDAIRQITGAR